MLPPYNFISDAQWMNFIIAERESKSAENRGRILNQDRWFSWPRTNSPFPWKNIHPAKARWIKNSTIEQSDSYIDN